MVSDRPRVLQVSKFYYPYLGGIEQVVRTVASRLHREGMSVRVLAARTRGRGSSERVDDVPVARLASLGTIASVPVAPTFPLRLSTLAARSDLVHYHLPNPLAVLSHLLVAPESPVVVTYHSDIVRQERALELYRPLLHRFLEGADRILVTSPRLVERSEILADHRERCTTVPLSVDPETYQPTDGAGDPACVDGDTLLFVGRLNYYKGVEYLVDAMAAVDADATLLVAGDGDRRGALERRARERGLDHRVRFLGRVPDAELHRLYQRADVFVLPSVEPSEAFGVVQLEAMAYETPVVNTDLPTGVPWVSRDGETGITVPPKDVEALAEAIDSLLADPDRRERYGRRGRERVEAEFSHDRRVARIAEVYRSLLG